jgi:Ca2+-binding RTX toxin-like protein
MSKSLATILTSNSVMAVAPAGSVGALVMGLHSSGLNPYAGSLAAMPSVDELIQSFQDALLSEQADQAALNNQVSSLSSIENPESPQPNLDDNTTSNATLALVDASMHRGAPLNQAADSNKPQSEDDQGSSSSLANHADNHSYPYNSGDDLGSAIQVQSQDAKSPHVSGDGSGASSTSQITSFSVSHNTVTDSTTSHTSTPDLPSTPDAIVDYGVVLIGSGDGQYLHGTSYADTLIGNSGNDTFDGGQGDDIYLVHSQDVLIQEAGAAGHDTLITDISSFHSVRNIEVLEVDDQSAVYTPYRDVSPIHDGAAAAFSLKGGFDTETIVGGYGSDFLQSSGSTTLVGHAGDDLYIYSGRETILEANNEGTDTVLSSVSLVLQDNVENAIAYGGAGIDMEGNSLNNLIIGNDQDNVLSGGSGNDVLVSLGGEDQLTGGVGSDTFILSTNEISYITDFQADDHLVFAINAPPTALSQVHDFTGVAGEWTFSEGLMQLDWNGDAQADSQIFLDNVSELNIDMVSVTSAYVSPL